MSQEPQRGRFVWSDLMTGDPAKARAFYTELFGWRVEEHDMGPEGTYSMLWNGSEGLGGIAPLGAGHDGKSHWVNYVSVDDVDAACARAVELGGKVNVPAFDIPNVGRTAELADPSGAIVNAFRPKDGATKPEKARPALGDFCWYELMTAKVEPSKAFYAGIFGWTWDKKAMGAADYWIGKSGETQRCGLLQIRPGVPHSHWLSYFAVEDHEASARRAESLGGKRLGPAVVIPDIGTFSPVKDAVGAPIALFQGA